MLGMTCRRLSRRPSNRLGTVARSASAALSPSQYDTDCGRAPTRASAPRDAEYGSIGSRATRWSERVLTATSPACINAVGPRSLGRLIRRGCGGFRLRSIRQHLGDAAVLMAAARADSGDELLGRAMGFVVRDLTRR